MVSVTAQTPTTFLAGGEPCGVLRDFSSQKPEVSPFFPTEVVLLIVLPPLFVGNRYWTEQFTTIL